MNSLQKNLFELLCEFDDICKRNNISYYLSGGTLLGALRHEGFIPWDDDIDINMTYCEYKKLEKVIDRELQKGRDLISRERYEDYCSPIPRYVRLDATLIRRNHLGDGTPHGVFLDIIILDNMPKNKELWHIWRKKHYAYCELLEPYYIIAARRRDWKDIDIDLYRSYQKKCKEKGRNIILNELEQELFGNDESSSDCYCMRFGTVWLGITPAEWYGSGRTALFEGREFPIPIKAEMEMYAFYGLQWKYIPKDKMEHKTLKLMGIECGNFEREFFKDVSKEEFNEIFFKYNDMALDKYRLKIDTYFDRHKPYISYIVFKIKKQIDIYGYDKVSSDAALCLQIFKAYIELQFSYEFIFNEYYIAIEDNLMILLTDALLDSGNVEKLKRLLEVKKKAEGKLPSELEKKLIVADDFVRMVNLVNLKEYESAKVIVDKYVFEYKDNLVLIKAKLEIDIVNAENKEGYEEILEYAEKALYRNPDDGELMKYTADILYGCGETEKSEKLYEKAKENTDNGILLLELSKRGHFN